MRLPKPQLLHIYRAITILGRTPPLVHRRLQLSFRGRPLLECQRQIRCILTTHA